LLEEIPAAPWVIARVATRREWTQVGV
jgi:hypothetical protein